MFFININRWRDSRHGQVHDVQRRRQHHVGLPIRGRLLQGGDGGHRLRHTRKVNFQIRHVLENFLGFFTHDNSLLPTINLCYPSKGLCFPIEGFVTQSKAYVSQSKALLPNRRLMFPNRRLLLPNRRLLLPKLWRSLPKLVLLYDKTR